MSAEVIPAPSLHPPRVSLLSTMPEATGVGTNWTIDGYVFEASCPTGVVKATDCGSYTDPGLARDNAAREQDAFYVIVSEECSTIGSTTRDWIGKVRAKLDAVRSYYVAGELWAAAVIAANLSLNETTSDTLTDEPTDIVRAVGFVEQALGISGKGQRGMIHVPANLASSLYRNNLVVDGGPGTLLSPMGHVYVIDAGYPGTGPGGVAADYSTWLYGTSWIEWFASPVLTIPDGDMDAAGYAQTLLRSTNLVEVFAMQGFGFRWDQCVHVAAEIDVPWSTIVGQGS